MKISLHETQVKGADGALQRFRAYQGKRALVCPNHANRHDPQVVFSFSRLVGEDFNFIAAREVFDWDKGFNGWWLQHLGCYSVVRGAPDRESFKTTKRILYEGKKKLVLFPEGEISRQNDTLMPLESGAAQMAFWALDDFAKQDGGNMPPLFIVPLALKYTFTQDVRPALSACLAELEARLSISPNSQSSMYQRLRTLAEKLLSTLEAEYTYKPAPNADINERVVALKGHVLASVSRQLNVSIPPNGKHLEAVRILRNAMDDVVYSDEHEASDYQRQIHEEKCSVIRGLYRDLDRVVTFIAIYEGYLKESMTQERFSDVLDRLETEIMRVREPSFRGPRQVIVDVGEGIDLNTHYQDYKSQKRATIAKIMDQLSAEMSRMLLRMESTRNPIKVD